MVQQTCAYKYENYQEDNRASNPGYPISSSTVYKKQYIIYNMQLLSFKHA